MCARVLLHDWSSSKQLFLTFRLFGSSRHFKQACRKIYYISAGRGWFCLGFCLKTSWAYHANNRSESHQEVFEMWMKTERFDVNGNDMNHMLWPWWSRTSTQLEPMKQTVLSITLTKTPNEGIYFGRVQSINPAEFQRSVGFKERWCCFSGSWWPNTLLKAGECLYKIWNRYLLDCLFQKVSYFSFIYRIWRSRGQYHGWGDCVKKIQVSLWLNYINTHNLMYLSAELFYLVPM